MTFNKFAAEKSGAHRSETLVQSFFGEIKGSSFCFTFVGKDGCPTIFDFRV